MSDTLYVASESDADGVDLSRFISLLGIVPDSAATFDPSTGAPVEHAWEVWQEVSFDPVFAPGFIEAFHAASRMDIATIVAADEKVESALSSPLSRKSIAAGKPFLDGKSEMKANREWLRFTEKVLDGVSPGHLCVLFAVQSSLYHLPLPAALSAFTFFEFQSRRGVFPFEPMTSKENRVFSSILPRIPLAVQRNLEENSNGNGSFRVI